MGNWNSGGGSLGGSAGDFEGVDFGGGSSSNTDNGSDSNDGGFFSGTFDDPGEAGFSGPSYTGQTGYDSEGTFWSASDVGASTSDVGWSVRGYEPVQAEDPFSTVSSYYGGFLSAGLPSTGGGTPGVDAPLPGLGGEGYRTFRDDRVTATGIPVTDISMTRTQAQLGYRRDAYTQDDYGWSLPGNLQDVDAARADYREATAYYDYMTNLEGTGLEPIGPYTTRAQQGVAGFFGDIANAIGTRLGTPYGEDFVIDVKDRAVGQVIDDHTLRDLAANGITFFAGLPVSNIDTATNVLIAGEKTGETRVFSGAKALGMQFGRNYTEEEFENLGSGDTTGGAESIIESILPSGVRQIRSSILGALLQTDTNQEIYTPSRAEEDPFAQLGVSPDSYREGYATGSVVGQQEPQGDTVVDSPIGFVGGTPESTPDGLTVRDDVPVDVDEKTFVINAAAVEIAGSQDIKDMLVEAIEEAKRQGIDIAQKISKIDTEREMSLLVSRGEVLVPPQIAKIIGYDRLEKINNRGLQETKRRIEKHGQADTPPESPANPAEGMAYV